MGRQTRYQTPKPGEVIASPVQKTTCHHHEKNSSAGSAIILLSDLGQFTRYLISGLQF